MTDGAAQYPYWLPDPTQPVIELLLPWPPAKLSPNARTHWAPAAKGKATYRSRCWAATLEQAGPRRPVADRFDVMVTFHPPDARRRDDDNMEAAFKAGRDGVCDALGMDDSTWSVRREVREPHRPDGAVRVLIVPLVEVRGEVS